MTTLSPVETVKASLKVVEQKRAILNRLEKAAATKIQEAKDRVEKAYNEKIEAASVELEAALETFRAAADIFKNGEAVVETSQDAAGVESEPEATEDSELSEAI